MASRRRKRRYTWLPTDPTYYAGGQDYPNTFYWTYITSSTDNAEAGREVLAIPIVPDYTQNAQAASIDQGSSLRDIVEGQDYVLKRTVGKVWGSLQQNDDTDSSVIASLVAHGLAVLPVNDLGQPQLNSDQYDPLNANNSMNPWMWRRTWMLYNNLAPAGGELYLGPNSIQAHGSVADGGHVDCKVARRVTREQRVFSIWTAKTILQVGEGEPIGRVFIGMDFRFLGAMRRHMNRSTFS